MSEIIDQVKEIGQKISADVAESLKGFAKKEDLTSIADDVKAIRVKADELDKQVQAIDAKAGQPQAKPGQRKAFTEAFAEAVEQNFDKIQNVSNGQAFKTVLKSVDTMTVANNLTGDAVRTYQPGAALVPPQARNFRELVPTVQSATGIYTLYRETGTEGSISVQGTPGAAKTQIDYDLTAVTYTARYIAGYARIDKSMMQDLPFLQTAVSQMLLRDFYKAENAKFYADMNSVVTGSTTTTATVDIEQIIDYIANLESNDYSCTGIVMNPIQWARILKTKPADYGNPGGVVVSPAGQVSILGVPVIKASWIADDKVLLGDWSYAKRVEVDGLKVEFFEQDSDNVQKNLVTVRIECREVLALDRLDAFTFADLGNA